MSTDEEIFDENYARAIMRLRPLLTDEFLATLILAARTEEGADYIATADFVEGLFALVDKPVPELTPFDYSKTSGE